MFVTKEFPTKHSLKFGANYDIAFMNNRRISRGPLTSIGASFPASHSDLPSNPVRLWTKLRHRFLVARLLRCCLERAMGVPP